MKDVTLGPARLQRHRHRAVVRDRLHLRALGRASTPSGRGSHGPARGGPRGPHDRAGRMTVRRVIRALPVAWVLCACHALGQSTATDVPPASPRFSARPPGAKRKRAGPSPRPSTATSFRTARTTCSRRSRRTGVAAPRGALQLRGPEDGLRLGRLQLQRREGTDARFHPHARRRLRRHDRNRTRVHGHAQLVEARALQPGRVRHRHRLVVRQLLLHVVGAHDGAGRLVPVRSRHPADEALPDRLRHPARRPGRLHLQEGGRDRLRLQPGREQAGGGSWPPP